MDASNQGRTTMPTQRPFLAATIATLGLIAGACTWVEPDAGGRAVRVAYGGDLSSCQRKGEVTVSVKADIAGIDRKALKVRDELESLARNEAATLGADTVQALEEPHDGEQRFAAYSCG
jgi:hypothetical protein